MVFKPEDYKWSSYAMLVGLAKEKLIDSNKILRYFEEENKMELYKEFIAKGINKIHID